VLWLIRATFYVLLVYVGMFSVLFWLFWLSCQYLPNDWLEKFLCSASPYVTSLCLVSRFIAEHSVSQYTTVNAPQRQSFDDTNLALQVMAAFNARD